MGVTGKRKTITVGGRADNKLFETTMRKCLIKSFRMLILRGMFIKGINTKFPFWKSCVERVKD